MKGKIKVFSPKNIAVPVCLAAALCLLFAVPAAAQKNRTRTQTKKPVPAATPAAPAPPPVAIPITSIPESGEEKYSPGTVVDETLAVLRVEPSLYAIPMQRMRRGRTVLIYSSKTVDGVLFYNVSLPPDKRGWVQAEAVATTIRRGDDERLVKLIQASEGFEQIERASIFLETFPKSPFRPALLLLQGDLIEEISEKLSLDANKKFNKDEMEATGAPFHSYFLNYNGLDRYRKLGIVFLFNQNTKYFHYDGEYWRELIKVFPKSNEAGEAKKRLESLKIEMEKLK